MSASATHPEHRRTPGPSYLSPVFVFKEMSTLPSLKDFTYQPSGSATGSARRAGRRIRPRIRGRFLKGPVPLDWLQRAANLPGKSLHVGVVLWYLVGLRKTNTLALPNGVLATFGVDRHAKYRALEQLESAGLISVVRQHGQNPVITVSTTTPAP
jgi:hypothetical protein